MRFSGLTVVIILISAGEEKHSRAPEKEARRPRTGTETESKTGTRCGDGKA